MKIGQDDPLAQTRQCQRNLGACLAEAGARPEDAVLDPALPQRLSNSEYVTFD